MSDTSERLPSGLLNTPFVISAILLGVTALALGPVTARMRIVLTKEAIPLRAQLGRLNKSALAPYRFVRGNTLDDAVVDTLETEQYIDWVLEDATLIDTSNPLRFARLFVTYYTGQPDPVPHTPDVCMVGAGYIAEQKANLTMTVPSFGEASEVPIRVLTFVKSGIYDGDKMTVVYTFHCNGRFAETRDKVRRTVNNPMDRFAYYSKVEVVFGWDRAVPRYPSRAESIKAAEKLLVRVLPLLVENHWPDWDAAVAEQTGTDS